MGSPAVTASDPVREHYAYLMAFARGELNDDALACMLATRHAGGGALPERLGLTPGEFRAMLAYHFPGALLRGRDEEGGLAAARADEADDLRRLLLGARAGQSPSEAWVAEILVAGCMGSNHLWQDLGLWARKDLSELMKRNVPPLAARNDRDMKWKKFLYKQLCETEGIYTCRAPSCEACVDFHVCFGPED
jgi:nitrogen fixation protein NifQ